MSEEAKNEKKPVFGIDLGTTYSAIAYIDETGRPSILKNVEGYQTTPSVVFFESESNIVVGDAAKQSAPAEPGRVVSFIKRDITNKDYKFVADGKEYDPVVISSFILKKLAKDAELELGKPVEDVVITCPAYFGTDEREATRLAGQIAGLNVLRILNEPTAAAFSYGLKLIEGGKRTILVYDLGGGTFDITIIKVDGKSIEVVVTGGDSTLGGKDWDAAIMQHLMEKWQEETGATENILSDNPDYIGIKQELALLSEKVKITLSAKEKMTVKFAPEGFEPLKRYEFTREKFNEITESLLARTIELTKDTLNMAAQKEGVDEFKFDEIILVGGSTKMPQVAERIKRDLNVEAKPFDPDQAVAKGAAIMAEIMNEIIDQQGGDKGSGSGTSGESEDGPTIGGGDGTTSPVEPSVKTKEVLSKSYGIVASYKGEKCVWNLLFSQATLPTSYTQRFFTEMENQRTIDIVLMENDIGVDRADMPKEERKTDIEFSKELGKNVLTIDDNLPIKSPIDVTININEEGRILVTAIDPNSGKSCNVESQSQFIKTEEEIKKIQEELSGLNVE